LKGELLVLLLVAPNNPSSPSSPLSQTGLSLSISFLAFFIYADNFGSIGLILQAFILNIKRSQNPGTKLNTMKSNKLI
jgi:hypothetical protein